MKRRSNDFFGGPTEFPGCQLPTYGDVGRRWKVSRLELEAKSPGKRIVNRAVAQDVITILNGACLASRGFIINLYIDFCREPRLWGLVHLLVGQSVSRLVGPLVCPSVMLLSLRAETSWWTTYFVFTNLFYQSINLSVNQYYVSCTKGLLRFWQNELGWRSSRNWQSYVIWKGSFPLTGCQWPLISLNLNSYFLVACAWLFKPFCWLLGPSVGWLVRLSVGQPIG